MPDVLNPRLGLYHRQHPTYRCAPRHARTVVQRRKEFCSFVQVRIPGVPFEYIHAVGAETLDGLDIQIRLLAEPDNPAWASLEVRAVIIDRVEEGFGGTRVTLHWSDLKQVEEITDDAGIACSR